MLDIEKNVPVPPGAGRVGRYPWAEMEVGDSFFVQAIHGKRAQSTIGTAGLSWAARNHPDRKFTVRKVDGGYRCWRIV